MVVRGSGPLPSMPVEEWPHRPAYFCAHPDVHTKDHEPGAPLPLNQFVEFETDLFVGKMLCRLKPIPPTDDGTPRQEQASDTISDLQSHEEYFKKSATHFQFVIQGRFREEISFSDLAMGDCYERPFYGVPKGLFMRMYERFMESVYPLTVMDMTSEHPRLFSPLASAQLMRVDLPGNEPDLTRPEVLNNLQEDTTLLFDNPTQTPKKPPREGTSTSSSRRRGHLTKAKHAVHYSTNPNHVYTIETCDNAMCFGTYYQYAVGFKIDMAKAMNGQALSFAIFRKSDLKTICKFPIWHERLLEQMKASPGAKEETPESESSTADRIETSWQNLNPSEAVNG